jgi:hypothetical protein
MMSRSGGEDAWRSVSLAGCGASSGRNSVMEEDRYPQLRPGMAVESADHQTIGEVMEVFRDVGDVESFGAKGRLPYEEGYDPIQYAYSEAMPGAGDDYFTVRQQDGGVLYIPFSAIHKAEEDATTVAVEADMIPDMNWKVRPDALASQAHDYPEDEGGAPQVA